MDVQKLLLKYGKPSYVLVGNDRHEMPQLVEALKQLLRQCGEAFIKGADGLLEKGRPKKKRPWKMSGALKIFAQVSALRLVGSDHCALFSKLSSRCQQRSSTLQFPRARLPPGKGSFQASSCWPQDQ